MFSRFSFSYTVYYLLILVLLFHHSLTKNFKVGDTCPFTDGTQGVCKYLTECQFALNALDDGDEPENSCTYEGTQSVFCCKDIGEASSSTTSAVTKTTTLSTSTTTAATTASTQPSSTTLSTSTTEQPSSVSTTSTTAETRKPEVVIGSRFKRIPGETSIQKCKDYAQFVYDMEESPVLFVQPQIASTFECAFEKLELIVGGTLASRQEFPHMVLIGYDTDEGIVWSCAGSLISENFVLSAAHCKERRLGEPARHAKLGITNQTDTYNMQQFTISEIIPYHKYTSTTKYHDIALFKLSEKAELNTFVRPACLQIEKEIPFEKAIASGWGNLEYNGKGSKDLLKVVLEFFTPEACNKKYVRYTKNILGNFKQGVVDDIMLCAGSRTEIKNTCEGDSGGPLQVYHKDTEDVHCMYDIVGVTSFGTPCSLAPDSPGIYTRVSAYIEWIEDIVWPE